MDQSNQQRTQIGWQRTSTQTVLPSHMHTHAHCSWRTVQNGLWASHMCGVGSGECKGDKHPSNFFPPNNRFCD